MWSEAIQYSALATLLSVVNGIQIAFLHARHPRYRLQYVDLAQSILLFSCSVVSLGLTCSSIKVYSVGAALLRGIISVLIPVPWVIRTNVVLVLKLGLALMDASVLPSQSPAH
jgi:hypothetical protein